MKIFSLIHSLENNEIASFLLFLLMTVTGNFLRATYIRIHLESNITSSNVSESIKLFRIEIPKKKKIKFKILGN